jgi:nitroreductase
MAEAPEDQQYLYAHVDAAFVSQNVYLFAASEGLATVVLGNVDKEALAEALGLGEEQILTFHAAGGVSAVGKLRKCRRKRDRGPCKFHAYSMQKAYILHILPKMLGLKG